MLAEHLLSGSAVENHLDFLCNDSALCALLSPERLQDAERHVADMNSSSWEFEHEEAGGRGLAYNSAQKSTDNRKEGMTRLLQCLSPGAGFPGPDFRILDVLGGDGTLARFCATLGDRMPTIYSADISKFMVDACRAQRLPCIRQSATRSLFRDNILDGVLIAYGSHHLGTEERPAAVREAHRTLKPGGRLVLHDFEAGGKSARWFETVVHPYSRTGHPHAHFSRSEMSGLFAGAGYRDVAVFEIDDPITLQGSSPEEAKHNAIMHMFDMYDLIKIADSRCDVPARLERHISETLGPISIRREECRYVAQISRQALVAVGTKPGPGD